MVVMAAYAPLFCKKGYNKWNSNLIWFDNRGMWRSTNYYYQKLFSVAGDRAFEMTPAMEGAVADTTVYMSPTIDTESGEIFIKFVNSECVDKVFTINTGNKKVYEASVEFISSHDTKVENQRDQNYYSSHPEYNQTPSFGGPRGERPGLREMVWRFGPRVKYTEAVVPHTKEYGKVKKSFEMRIPENSVGIIRLKPVK
jgi:alpha-L-arabinofuranosidase